jgi:hypothetical protein
LDVVGAAPWFDQPVFAETCFGWNAVSGATPVRNTSCHHWSKAVG